MSESILPLSSATPAATPVPMIDLVEQHESIAGEVRDAVEEVFATQRFVLGDEVVDFEHEVASYCDARFAIGCASGSDALMLSLMALDIGPGDEVITSPFTFFATASSITRTGATPVFVDIDPHTYNLDPAGVEAALSPRTRAIMPVHLFGRCAEMEPLWRVAVRHNLAIVEDAAQAIGATHNGRHAGVLGTLGCFSFFPTKNLGGAGDGGLITSDDPDLTARLRRLRVHGDAGRYQHVEVGINSRLDALQAAVLRVKLRHLSKWTQQRQENAARYEELVADSGLNDLLDLPTAKPGCNHVFNQYVVRVHNGRRDEVLDGLRARDVGCAVYYPQPLHLQTCFQSLKYQEGDFPESERASAETVALPIYPELGAARQELVVRAISDSLGVSRAHRERTFSLPQHSKRAA
ncbi:MAG: DegT/DnrJ/EryC1/StrS family aminotransferase [Planctomycetaceae bacterium]|nr:DegT/DnrJ/EryC1/StrS family aminotransferase [Planctomycetaceae bacterium]